MAETVAYIPLEYPRDDTDIEIYQPFSGKKKHSSSRKSSKHVQVPDDPKPSTPDKKKESRPSSSKSNAKKRDSSSSHGSTSSTERLKKESECQDPNCELCQALKRTTSTNSRPKFLVVDGDQYVPPAVSEEPNSYRKIPDHHGSAKPQYNFTKKLGQLDAAIKMLNAKVEEEIMKERYAAADELQNACNNLRETKIELIDLLDDREDEIENGDLKAAQELKDAYDQKLEKIDMDTIKPHLTPNEVFH